MTDQNDQADVEDRLWKELGGDHLGMLGVRGGKPAHFKPMTPYCEKDANRIWFFAKKDVDLAEAARAGGTDSLLVFQGKDGKFQASIAGRLTESFSAERRDKYWNAAAAAYFPDGKDDPQLTMLCLDLTDAEVWHSEAGPVRFAWEVAKANLTKKEPDLGGKTDLSF